MEQKTHHGSCHCGKVKYEVKTDLASVIECNCSICSRAGYLLTFVPADQFKLLSGEGAQKDYLFNKHHIHHMFCTDCGIHSFATAAGKDGKPMFAVNVRCLEGVDPKTLQIKAVDGRSL